MHDRNRYPMTRTTGATRQSKSSGEDTEALRLLKLTGAVIQFCSKHIDPPQGGCWMQIPAVKDRQIGSLVAAAPGLNLSVSSISLIRSPACVSSSEQ
jgi:hypothetical protein